MVLWGQSYDPPPKKLNQGLLESADLRTQACEWALRRQGYNQEGPMPFQKGLPSRGHLGEERGTRHCFLQGLE